MATTVTPSSFKSRFSPTFDCLTDNQVQAAIDQSVRWLNESCWGECRYDDAVTYLTGHWLTIDAQIQAAGSPAAAATSTSTGAKKSEKLLTWSASWATPGVFESDPFGTTSFGQQFLSLRSLVFCCRVL